MARRLSDQEINDVLDKFSDWLTYDNIVSIDVVTSDEASDAPDYELVVGQLREGLLSAMKAADEALGMAPNILDIPPEVRLYDEDEGIDEDENFLPRTLRTRVESVDEVLEDELLVSLEGPEIAEEESTATKVRPCPGGYLIKTAGFSGRGSLGTSISYRGRYRLLSNNHVIAKNDSVGKWVFQPAVENTANRLRKVTGFDRITYYSSGNPTNPQTNEKDVAWCDSDAATTSQEVRGIGAVAGRRAPVRNERIEVFGGKTGVKKTAEVKSTTLRYKSKGTLGYSFWRNGIELDANITQPGDSGSAYIAASDKKLVGLHRAGGSSSKGCPL